MFAKIIYQGNANKTHGILRFQTNKISDIKQTENFKWWPKRVTTRMFTHYWREDDRVWKVLKNWLCISNKVKEN